MAPIHGEIRTRLSVPESVDLVHTPTVLLLRERSYRMMVYEMMVYEIAVHNAKCNTIHELAIPYSENKISPLDA